jgi:hypothetical protein
MSTPNSTAPVAPRFQIRVGTVLTALGALVAIAVTVITLALTGADHSTVATPATASQVASGSTPQVQYLGPRQLGATLNGQGGGGTTPTAGAGNVAPHYACLGAAQRCLR